MAEIRHTYAMDFDTLAKELSRGRALKLLGLSSLALFIPQVAEGKKKRRKHKKKNRANKVSPIIPPTGSRVPPEAYICAPGSVDPRGGPRCGERPGTDSSIPPRCFCTLSRETSTEGGNTCGGLRTRKSCTSSSDCMTGQFCGLDTWGGLGYICIYHCQVRGGFILEPERP